MLAAATGIQKQQVVGECMPQSFARPAGSPNSEDILSASVGASPLSDSEIHSFESPAEQAGKPASPFDHSAFGLEAHDDLSNPLGWGEFLVPENSFTWNQQNQQSSWQPAALEGLTNPFAGQAAFVKHSPVETGKEGSTPRSSGDSAEGSLLDLQGTLNSAASEPADALGLRHHIRTACKAALEGMPLQQSPQVSGGQHTDAGAALVTTGSIKSAPYGKRTVKTVEERKAHRMAKNRATAAASRKRKQEAAQELVQRQERLSRENHELLELLQGRELLIVELRKRIAEAECHNASSWSPASSDAMDLYWEF
ncbi:hypothetical protein WJX73_009159 [Symbiochloris irregularis]|uniref:BZIP domain-containing protein n=1 Tax=Symbiochloris irregularis TaxID=706552 RepID=A0AAW1NWQ9_9CHLO